MADGYTDEQGNYIPGDFADQLDLPAPASPNSADAAAANIKLSAAKAKASSSTAQLKTRNAQLAAQKKAITAKGISAKTKANRQRAYDNAVKQTKLATTANQALIKAQTSAQNKYYTATGQYDKLLQGANRDAYLALQSLFNGFGLGSLAPKIFDFAKQGYGADVISLLLADTPEYKERFAGNEARKKAGLPVLSPAEYLSTERSYRQIMQDAGLPKGFYDSPTDFTKWIAGDVSPNEIKGRVDLAVAQSGSANNSTKQALDMLYGVDESHVTAYFLDPTRALPLLQKQAAAATFGAEALKRNLTLDRQDLEDFATAGLSLSQVSQGFQQVAEMLPNIQAIAERYGETFTQREAEKDVIEGGVSGNPTEPRFMDENPSAKRKRLVGNEKGLFTGQSGATPQGLAQAQYLQS
jgi:hypothetical protein